MEEIVLCPYNPKWKIYFEREKELLGKLLDGEYKSIIHIGSTSIEGMTAKPIVDISIALHKLENVAFYEEKLSSIGYIYRNGSQFEEWILFNKDHPEQQYHLHFMAYDNRRLLKQILFKIYLEEDFEVADLYVRKKKAFLRFDEHMWYSMNKLPFVEEVSALALIDAIRKPYFWRERVKNIMGYIPYAELFDMNSELSKAQYIRNLFTHNEDGKNYYKEFIDTVEYMEMIDRILKVMTIEKTSEVTGLTKEELENRLAYRS